MATLETVFRIDAMTKISKSSTIPILMLICGSLIAFMTFGPRSAMGFFQLPMLEAHGWDRTTFALAMALQNLIWGLGQPFFWRDCRQIGHLAGAGIFRCKLCLRSLFDVDSADTILPLYRRRNFSRAWHRVGFLYHYHGKLC